MPDGLHLGARLRLIHAEHIPVIAVEESRDPVIGDAVHMHRDILQLLHDGAELPEVLFGRVLEIDRDVDVLHAEPADARSLVGQRLLVRVEREIDDVFDAEIMDSASCSSVG